VTESEANQFAAEWVEAWNSHDLERILAHYSEDVELISPLVQKVLGTGEDWVRGKADLRTYFSRGLAAFPDLKFQLWGAYPGVESVVVHYQSVAGRASAEFMRLDGDGRVSQVIAHYSSPDPAGRT
jgi:hypothetical protein